MYLIVLDEIFGVLLSSQFLISAAKSIVMLLSNHIVINKIEDVLLIPDLNYKFSYTASRLVDKIQFFESRGLYLNEHYQKALKQARDLMIELQSKSDYIHYNDL